MFSHIFVRIRRCGKNGNMLFFLLSPHTPNQKKRTPSKFDKPIADKADKFDLDNIEASTSLYTMMLLMMRTLTYARTHTRSTTYTQHPGPNRGKRFRFHQEHKLLLFISIFTI